MPSYFIENDPLFIERLGINTNYMVNIDLHMKELVRVDDLYKDGTTFVKSLVKG